MPGQTVIIILNKVYNKSVSKSNNLHPGYDLKYVHNVQTYNDNYRLKKVVKIERRYDYLSIITALLLLRFLYCTILYITQLLHNTS